MIGKCNRRLLNKVAMYALLASLPTSYMPHLVMSHGVPVTASLCAKNMALTLCIATTTMKRKTLLVYLAKRRKKLAPRGDHVLDKSALYIVVTGIVYGNGNLVVRRGTSCSARAPLYFCATEDDSAEYSVESS